MIGFDFVLRPFRMVYIAILAAGVYLLTKEYLPTLLTLLAIFDLDMQEIKEYLKEKFGD